MKHGMKTKQISLAAQIKKVIGNRILFCSIAFMLIIFGLTIYDLSISIKQLRSRINEQIRPIEEFAINQAMINNLDTVNLKIENFNENSPTFQIEWIRQGSPTHKTITWHFPFSWVYDYRVDEIAGFQFGYFRITGGFLSDTTLTYDLLFRLSLLLIFIISILSVLYPLATKIPKQLFIDPINRFINLISNNSVTNNSIIKSSPVEMRVLEKNILALLKTATEHERNKAMIELGHLSARLAHDIHSPLAAMEMGLHLLTKKVPHSDLAILTNGIQSVRDIANNVLERYRSPNTEANSSISITAYDDGNVIRPILLFSLTEMIVSQKRHEWHQQLCELTLIVSREAKINWIMAAPNEVKRLLSNLLNNAYDALVKKSQGIINITLDLVDEKLHLKLHDNGIGIAPDKISDVLNGISFKHLGKGLGLPEAKQYIENLSGRLDIHSTVGKGTTISLVFPRIDNIEWFSIKISLNGATVVIVLDDDSSMLMYWQQRINETGLRLKLFSAYNDALEWVENNTTLAKSAIFLVDYNLADNTVNGLMFLEKVRYNNNRYLITSHAEKYHFQQKVKTEGVWLIPKVLVNEIDFSFQTQ